MKIQDIQILRIEKIERDNFPYVKPTDYYLQVLGETSPFNSAFMDEVCFLGLKSENDVISIVETSVQACRLAVDISKVIKGLDLSNRNMIWDLLYRYTLPIGRSGIILHAISAIDLLIHDSYAKELGIPVYNLLGGKTRDKIRAYASHLHPTANEELEKEALSYIEQGFTAMKMRFSSGPSDPLGVEKNVQLVRTIRDAVGYDVELAGDAWMSWNLNFSLKMAKKLSKYEVTWIEEPLLPDDFDGYNYLTKKTEISIAAGEHHYYLYDFKRLLDSGVRILQPDSLWVGGITAMKRISGMAESYGAIIIPHTSNIYNLHFIISEPESVCTMAEYLTRYRWLEDHVKNPPRPDRGMFKLEELSGFGLKYSFS
ncbi:enolase C-terminal domain-like protein [Candidatus Acidianus copahuensis]|nr:enolase C-terminal domain-like protein [Candidatus Acidianus copahuensis]